MTSSKVLSIDWDYFVDASIDFKTLNFPDGGNENLPSSILDSVWMSRYGQSRELHKIKEDSKELIKLRILLKNSINPHTKVIIADSHKDIYKYIGELRETNFPIELYNIDFHHDMYDFGNEEVDCGNWLRKFINAENSSHFDKFMWIRREDSELSGEELLDDNSVVGIPSDMPDSFQLVFLCRSGVWSPPHLDSKFLSICRLLSKLQRNTMVTKSLVLRDRYNQHFKSNVKAYGDIIKGINRI